VLVNTCDPGIWKAEAGGSQIGDQPSKTLSQKTKKKSMDKIKFQLKRDG
jgi:hypothetical protein